MGDDMTKEQIRIQQKEHRNKLMADEHKTFSTAVRERLLHTEAFQKSSMIFTFVSFQSEIDTFEIIRACLSCKKRVFIPKVESWGMEFYEISGLEGLIRSKYGILEPQSDEKTRYQDGQAMRNERKLMLMPGLAFDQHGNRVGYGAGYYDRYLKQYPPAEFDKIALAYDFQVMEQVPADEYDIRVDVVITPTREFRCR